MVAGLTTLAAVGSSRLATAVAAEDSVPNQLMRIRDDLMQEVARTDANLDKDEQSLEMLVSGAT